MGMALSPLQTAGGGWRGGYALGSGEQLLLPLKRRVREAPRGPKSEDDSPCPERHPWDRSLGAARDEPVRVGTTQQTQSRSACPGCGLCHRRFCHTLRAQAGWGLSRLSALGQLQGCSPLERARWGERTLKKLRDGERARGTWGQAIEPALTQRRPQTSSQVSFKTERASETLPGHCPLRVPPWPPGQKSVLALD